MFGYSGAISWAAHACGLSGLSRGFPFFLELYRVGVSSRTLQSGSMSMFALDFRPRDLTQLLKV